jgi:hypothetical protein
VTTPFDDESRPLSVLRIYLRRRTIKAGPGFWRRPFGVSTARHLAEQALRAGAVHETITLGHMGFVRGARRVWVDVSDVPRGTLPIDGVGAYVSGAGPT